MIPEIAWYRSVAPFPWMGSKSRLAGDIIHLFPAHTAYVEPFGGSAAVLLSKQPSDVEVYNDASHWLTNFFRVLQNPEERKLLLDRLEWTPYSREEYELAIDSLDDPDPVVQAWAFFVAQGQGFGGTGALRREKVSWGVSRVRDQNVAFRGRIDKMMSVARRLRDVAIESDDALSVITRWDDRGTLFYLDPPYVDSTRASKTVNRPAGDRGTYQVETDDGFHDRLVALLLQVKGMVLLSGYPSDVYTPLEDAGWVRREFDLELRVSGHTRKYRGARVERSRTECLWISPTAQASQNHQVAFQLFDDLGGAS